MEKQRLNSQNRKKIIAHLNLGRDKKLLTNLLTLLYDYEDAMIEISKTELPVIVINSVFNVYYQQFKERYRKKCVGKNVIIHFLQHMQAIKAYYTMQKTCGWNGKNMFLVYKDNFRLCSRKKVAHTKQECETLCEENPQYKCISIDEYLSKKYKFARTKTKLRN